MFIIGRPLPMHSACLPYASTSVSSCTVLKFSYSYKKGKKVLVHATWSLKIHNLGLGLAVCYRRQPSLHKFAYHNNIFCMCLQGFYVYKVLCKISCLTNAFL